MSSSKRAVVSDIFINWLQSKIPLVVDEVDLVFATANASWTPVS